MCVCGSRCGCGCDNMYVRRWLCGARMRLSPRTKSLFEAHGSRHPTRRRRCLWVGGGSRRSGEEEARGLGRRQHHPLVAARLVTGDVCVFVCVVFIGADC